MHQNNLARPAADRVPVVLLGAVIVPAALGAYSCGYGAFRVFAAAGTCDRYQRYHGSGGAPDILPIFENDAEK